MPQRTEKLLEELRRWCDAEHGRRVLVARKMGVERQVVTNWLAGRQQLTGEQALALLEFLKRHQ
jgi:hypothetical protein